jgi:hypothetical protein
MTKRGYKRYKWIQKIAILMAAAPLFQASQCATGLRQTTAATATTLGVSDSWSVTILSLLQSFTQLFFGV